MKRRIALFFIAKKLIAPFFLIRLMHFKEEIFASSLISYKLRKFSSSSYFPSTSYVCESSCNVEIVTNWWRQVYLFCIKKNFLNHKFVKLKKSLIFFKLTATNFSISIFSINDGIKLKNYLPPFITSFIYPIWCLLLLNWISR